MPEQLTDPIRMQAAREIARSFGSSMLSGTPESIVNQAVREFVDAPHEPAQWKTAGKMLNIATKMDIPWDRAGLRVASKLALGLTESSESNHLLQVLQEDLRGDPKNFGIMVYDRQGRYLDQIWDVPERDIDDTIDTLKRWNPPKSTYKVMRHDDTIVRTISESVDGTERYIHSLSNPDRQDFARQAVQWYHSFGRFPDYGDAGGPGSLSLNLLDRQAILSKLSNLLGEDSAPKGFFMWSYVTRDGKYNGKMWRYGNLMDRPVGELEIFDGPSGALIKSYKNITQRQGQAIWDNIKKTGVVEGQLGEAAGAAKKIPVAGKMVPDTEVEKTKTVQKVKALDFETSQERELESARRRDFEKGQNQKKAELRNEDAVGRQQFGGTGKVLGPSDPVCIHCYNHFDQGESGDPDFCAKCIHDHKKGESAVNSFGTFLRESGEMPFFDASDLGWKPGYWPATFTFPGFGIANRFELARDNEGDIQFARYMTVGTQKEIHVFND